MTTVLAIGETMLLVAPAVPEPLETAERFVLDVAGAESNVASHLVREGVAAGWAGAVGAGGPGRRVLATLAARGVDVAHAVVDDSAPTGVLLKDPDPAGRRVHYYRRDSATARLDAGFAATLPLGQVPWVHLSGITPALSAGCADLIDEVLARRRSAGLPVSFDVNFRPALWPATEAAGRLLDLAARSDLVFVGADEAAELWGATTTEAIRALLPHVPELVVKDGGAAAHVFAGEAVVSVAALPVAVVEPVGAGDAFAAGYLAARLAGADLGERLARAHASAARVLTITTDY